MAGPTWAHRATHPLVQVLVDTPVTPNHLTALRLLTGIAAAALFALGRPGWGGFWFLVSTLLDRADGELARMSGRSSPFGHQFDLASDVLVTVLLFVGIGIGLAQGPLGSQALMFGLVAGASVALIFLVVIRIEALAPGSTAGEGPVDPDDALFLVTPVAWLGWLEPLLVLAAIGAPLFLLLASAQLWWLHRKRAIRQSSP
ncbi:MAG: CDP-alcohol phosphatidyltransferase family protein [Chromatiales bacterium]|nr:CDP-alcohol phosphatidyltransferase family protein [Chromatiales bacterium]